MGADGGGYGGGRGGGELARWGSTLADVAGTSSGDVVIFVVVSSLASRAVTRYIRPPIANKINPLKTVNVTNHQKGEINKWWGSFVPSRGSSASFSVAVVDTARVSSTSRGTRFSSISC